MQEQKRPGPGSDAFLLERPSRRHRRSDGCAAHRPHRGRRRRGEAATLLTTESPDPPHYFARCGPFFGHRVPVLMRPCGVAAAARPLGLIPAVRPASRGALASPRHGSRLPPFWVFRLRVAGRPRGLMCGCIPCRPFRIISPHAVRRHIRRGADRPRGVLALRLSASSLFLSPSSNRVQRGHPPSVTPRCWHRVRPIPGRCIRGPTRLFPCVMAIVGPAVVASVSVVLLVAQPFLCFALLEVDGLCATAAMRYLLGGLYALHRSRGQGRGPPDLGATGATGPTGVGQEGASARVDRGRVHGPALVALDAFPPVSAVRAPRSACLRRRRSATPRARLSLNRTIGYLVASARRHYGRPVAYPAANSECLSGRSSWPPTGRFVRPVGSALMRADTSPPPSLRSSPLSAYAHTPPDRS